MKDICDRLTSTKLRQVLMNEKQIRNNIYKDTIHYLCLPSFFPLMFHVFNVPTVHPNVYSSDMFVVIACS